MSHHLTPEQQAAQLATNAVVTCFMRGVGDLDMATLLAADIEADMLAVPAIVWLASSYASLVRNLSVVTGVDAERLWANICEAEAARNASTPPEEPPHATP